MKKRIAILLALVLTVFALVGCSEKPASGGNKENPKTEDGNKETPNSEGTKEDDTKNNARYEVSGKVVVAFNEGRSTDTYALLNNFNKYYPNIEVELLSYDIPTSEFLTAQAATGTMPDVVFDDASTFHYYVSQGWVHPLNDLIGEDEDFSYVPQPILDSYSYGGKLYALPMQAHFNAIFLNLDLVDRLNIDVPELDWSPKDYEELLKKATTTENSGTEILWGIDEVLAGTMKGSASYYGYNAQERKFETSKSWVDAVNLMVDLRAYPGLEAWSLRNSNVDGDSNDYVKKFGQGNLDDIHMAFKMGKILTDPRGTWDVSWLKELPFEWEFIPYPQGDDAKGHLPMHVDGSWITSTAQNVEAAYEFVRYVTFSKEGNLERIGMYETGDTDDYTLKEVFYIPTTNHPEVAERFKGLETVTPGIAYMYDNMNNSFRADLGKFVPGWDQVNNEYLSPRGNEVRDGISDAASVAAELDDVATKAIQGYWNDFNEQVKQVQEEFDSKN